MDNEPVKVVEDNDHLGQIVTGFRQEENNLDERIIKGRNSLFGLLGAAFSYKCHLSPVLKIHLFRTYTCPIIRSGLSSFALRTNQLSSLAIFHSKNFEILSLSQQNHGHPCNTLHAWRITCRGKDSLKCIFSILQRVD